MQELIKIAEQRKIFNKIFTIYGTYENPLFLAKEVAGWIEHSDVSTMLRKVDAQEKVTNNVCTLGGIQNCWFLTEDGLYEVLMQSRKPIAKQFKAKVKEILREIRKTGKYSTKPQQQSLEPSFTPAIRTYRGRRVVTIKDIMKATNKSEGTIQYALHSRKVKCKEGTDYHVLKGDELRHFKKENDLYVNYGVLMVVLESGFVKLCKHFGILPNSTGCFLVTEKPKEKLPESKTTPSKLAPQFNKVKRALIALDVSLAVHERACNRQTIESLQTLAINVMCEVTHLLRINDQLQTQS